MAITEKDEEIKEQEYAGIFPKSKMIWKVLQEEVF